MPDNDLNYYRRRAEFELERAQAATLPKVVAAHYQLASAYLDRVHAARGPDRTAHD